MTGRLLLVAQKLTPMLLQVQPTGRERIPPEEFDRLSNALRGLSDSEIEELAVWVTPVLARRRLAPRPPVREGALRSALQPGRRTSAQHTTGGFEALFLLVNLADCRFRPAIAVDQSAASS